MSKAQVTITREIVSDTDPDASYLDQEGFEERRAEYYDNQFNFIGVRAVAEIRVPYGRDWIVTKLKSPGLWGIESDSGEDYIAEVFEEEKATLIEMLESLHEFELV